MAQRLQHRLLLASLVVAWVLGCTLNPQPDLPSTGRDLVATTRTGPGSAGATGGQQGLASPPGAEAMGVAGSQAMGGGTSMANAPSQSAGAGGVSGAGGAAATELAGAAGKPGAAGRR